MGAKCAVTYIGSYLPGSDYGPARENLSPDAFDAAVETARALIDAVKPNARISRSMMQYSLPDSVDIYVEMIEAVDRPEFAAHLDRSNFIMTPRQYFDSGALIRECFAKLGRWLVSSHAKDIVLHHQAALHFDEIMPCAGALDYRTYLTELDRAGNVPLMLEHLPMQTTPSRETISSHGDMRRRYLRDRDPSPS